MLPIRVLIKLDNIIEFYHRGLLGDLMDIRTYYTCTSTRCTYRWRVLRSN